MNVGALRVIRSDCVGQPNCCRRQLEGGRQQNAGLRLPSDRDSSTAGDLDERWKTN